MIDRDLKVIADYIRNLKLDPELSDMALDLDNAVDTIENIRQSLPCRGRPNLSITLPSQDNTRCNICSKLVVSP